MKLSSIVSCFRLFQVRNRSQVSLPSVPTAVEASVEDPIKPKKKALLIGVQNTKGNDLRGPHKDVEVMKKLLIEKYDYQPENIITLIDSKNPKQKQPTYANMIEEMKNLVKGAKAGDRFFFHYAGHARQVKNKDNKEEDGNDECIIPSDCESGGSDPEDPKLIKDDLLKSILVDNLPTGSHLVAIFDSCHSASLLDLKHFRCNRVYVPWISKGRRKSDSMWHANVRKNAALFNPDTRTIYQTTRMSNEVVKTRKTSLSHPSEQPQSLPSTPASHLAEFIQEPSSSSSISSPRPRSPVTAAQPVSDIPQTQGVGSVTDDKKHQPTITIKCKFSPWILDEQEKTIYESPVEQFCSGMCREFPWSVAGRRATMGNGRSPVRRPLDSFPNVISLGSCKDSEKAWEVDGTSMTQSLAEILSKNPHPTLHDFMTQLSHTLHDRVMRMHEENMKFKKARKWWRIGKGKKAPRNGDTKGNLEFNNFQDPQLSSHQPLDMNSQLMI